MTSEPSISLWAVYFRPLDFPNHVVVREQRVASGSKDVVPALVGCLYDSVAEANREWSARGLTWLPRFDDDDPPIVGVWL